MEGAAAGDELPALEVAVGQQVRFPGVSHGGLEGQYQQARPAHASGQLVGGKGLAEAHLAVPEKVGRLVGAFASAVLEVGGSLLHGLLLFGAHAEGLGAGQVGVVPAAHGFHGLSHVLYRAAEPFARRVVDVLHAAQAVVHVVVGEGGAVFAHGGGFVADDVGQGAGAQRGVLLADALLHADGGVAYFQQAAVLRVCVLVGVYLGSYVGTLGEEGNRCHKHKV